MVQEAVADSLRMSLGPWPVFGIIEIQRTAAKMSQEKLKIKKA